MFVRGGSVTQLLVPGAPESLRSNESGDEASVSVEPWPGKRFMANGKPVSNLRDSVEELLTSGANLVVVCVTL